MRIPLERLFDDPPITGADLNGVRWRPDGSGFSYLKASEEKDEGSDLWTYSLSTGERSPLCLAAQIKEQDPEAGLDGYEWLPDGSLLLLSKGRAWRCNADGSGVESLLMNLDDQVTPQPSPDGKLLAYVREGDLWLMDVKARIERALTRDGDGVVLNGKLDWAYWEELSNRGSWRSFEWSPDGKAITYLRLDQSLVPEHPLVDGREPHARLKMQRYPRPGDPNSTPSLHIVAVEDGRELAAQAELGDGHYYGPEPVWSADSREVIWTRLTRDQRCLEVRALQADGGSRLLFTEEDPHWLNRIGPATPLPDGSFLWLSERTGFSHIYRYGGDGALIGALTAGSWQVDQIHGLHDDQVYFTGTSEDARERLLYRVPLEGGDVEALTPNGCCASTSWRKEGGGVVTLARPDRPAEKRLLRPDGSLGETLRTPDPAWEQYDWACGEFIDIQAEDGTPLHGRILRPRDFDPAKRYPVVVHVYGGPHAQTVRMTWEGADALDQLLVQEGALVWRLDNRGSWGRGHAFETPLDRAVYATELRDQLAGVEFLKSLPYVDPERIGITGWSYGGSMTLYSLTRAPDVWRCGAAGAPVTDWALYDSIYTERYMGTPAENPDGYRQSSILEGAKDLQAPLLLIHGTDDDNVHLHNTLQFVEKLSEHGKPYDLLIQPGQKHGFSGKSARTYLHQRMLAFFKQHLGL